MAITISGSSNQILINGVPVISDTQVVNTYTKQEIDSVVEEAVGDINQVLDAINGEVM